MTPARSTDSSPDLLSPPPAGIRVPHPSSPDSRSEPPSSDAAFETVARSGLLLFFGFPVRAVLLFVTEVLLARHLGADGYGLISWGFMAISLVSILTVFGMNTSAQRFVPMWRTRERLDRLKGDLLFMTKAALLGGAVGMGLIIVFAPTIATDVFGDPRESTILRTLAFAVPSWNLLKLILGIAAGFKRPGLKVIIEDFVLSACLLGVAVTATWLNLNPADVAIGYAFSYGVTGVTGSILIARLRDIRSLATVDSVSSIGSLLSFSWPLILVGMLGKVTGMTDILILGGLAPASDVGLYRVASDLAVTLSILLMVFGFLYLPVASELHAHGNREGWKDLNGRVARWAMLLGFPVFAILYFRSEDVVTLFYGAEFGASSLALKILAVGYFFHIMVGFTGTNLTVDGRTKSQLVVHLAAFGVNIVGNLTLVPIIGIEGAATATLASLVIVNAASIVLTFRWLGIQPFGSRYLIALILLLAGAYFLDFLSRVLFAGLRSAIVFAASIVALWFVLFLLRISADPSDITLAKRLIARRDAAA